MTECYQTSIEFSSVKRRKVQANFEGGDITSDAGLTLLREVDRKIGLSSSMAKVIPDSRRAKSCDHDLITLIRQRIFAIAAGYEDLADHQTLREDIALQACSNQVDTLASPPTLCRFENQATRETTIALHQVLFDQFVAAHPTPPKRLILDFDATDAPLHGNQEGRFFHGYYDRYCFLPLYVFCERHLLVGYLRPSNIDGAKHSWAILSLLVKALRKQWPGVEIIFRADSGFCRRRMLSWCERHGVKYVIGLAKNSRNREAANSHIALSESLYKLTGKKQRLFTSIYYGAKTWDKKRRVIVKAEHTAMGSNPRFVVTNMTQSDRYLYDKLYCARGDMENRIKDQQLSLFANRVSCHRWWANQFRLLLSGMAYVLVEAFRRLALEGTELEKASPQTIRVKVFKIGAVVVRNTRRIRFLMSSAYPYQSLFRNISHHLNSS